MPSTDGKSAGCSCSASPMPAGSVVSPAQRKRPQGLPRREYASAASNLVSAPTKIIGNAAAVSETRTPMSATNQPVQLCRHSRRIRAPALAETSARPHSPDRWSSWSLPLEDCTISVTIAPQAPDSGVAAALLRIVRSLDPASPLRPAVMTSCKQEQTHATEDRNRRRHARSSRLHRQ